MWQRLWWWIDTAMDSIIWSWDMLMIYVAALFLIPLCMVASLRVAGVATVWSAFAGAELENAWFRLVLLGAPFWLAFTLYARLAQTPGAIALRDQLERWKWAMIWATCGGMGVFALSALIFAT